MGIDDAEVSVVMPVYNGACYLREALNSLLAQTFLRMEIICINDCSDDETEDILEEYSAVDKRIKVLRNRKRMGAAEARNIGITATGAPYFICLDADDVFEECFLQEMYRAAESFEADVTICETDTFQKKYNREYAKISYLVPERYCRETFSIEDLNDAGLNQWGGAVWNKLIRKDFFQEKELRFQNLSSSNDVFVSDICLLLANKIIHTEHCGAMVHHRLGTSTQISNNRDPFCSYEALKAEYNYMRKESIYFKYKRYFDCKAMFVIIGEIKRCRNENWRSEFAAFIQGGALEKIGIKTSSDLTLKSLQKYYCRLITPGEEWWYKQEAVVVNVLLELHWDKMKAFASYIIEHRVKTAVFGAGLVGQAFVRCCRELGINTLCIVDNDKSKQGRFIEGGIVKGYDEMAESIDLVVLMFSFYPEICYQVVHKEPRVTVFSMDAYLRLDEEFDRCFI